VEGCWCAAGRRDCELSDSKKSSEIGIAFPRWKGTESVLEARKEYRIFRQPIISVPSSPIALSASEVPAQQGASRTESQSNRTPAPDVTQRVAVVDLNGKWKLHDADKSEGEKLGYHNSGFDDAAWREVSVPGTVHTQILEAPKYFTREAEWISAREWWYRRSFSMSPQMATKRVFLAFGATDYYADIYLNGELIARHEGYIDPYEIEVTGKLSLSKENQLSIRVWTPVSYYWRHRPYTVKGSYGAVDQKPDNITPLGITRPVSLIARGALRIEDLGD
jgi:hypothetical protein